jgi:hypothetical protein
LELETPAKEVSEVVRTELASQGRRRSSLGWTVAIFVALWVALFALDREFPYLKNGSDIIFQAKLRFERQGQIFPPDRHILRVMMFGDSKMLAGFLPSLFDQLATTQNQNVSAFNSGFPGTDVFLPELEQMCRRGEAPNILILTLPWKADPPKWSIFHLVSDDHEVVTAMFPFRNWLRDFTDFLMTARSHGGLISLYKESQQNERQVIADRGYYLITEQSRFPTGRLPDDFHLASDQPGIVKARTAPRQSAGIGELNRLIRQYHMRCYFVPYYLRIGESASPPARDQQFASAVESATPCKLLGPDYFLYPNRLFSDQTHLNTAGARVYTKDLFRLLENQLSQGSKGALQ